MFDSQRYLLNILFDHRNWSHIQGVPINMGIERQLESRLWFPIFMHGKEIVKPRLYCVDNFDLVNNIFFTNFTIFPSILKIQK